MTNSDPQIETRHFKVALEFSFQFSLPFHACSPWQDQQLLRTVMKDGQAAHLQFQASGSKLARPTLKQGAKNGCSQSGRTPPKTLTTKEERKAEVERSRVKQVAENGSSQSGRKIAKTCRIDNGASKRRRKEIDHLPFFFSALFPPNHEKQVFVPDWPRIIGQEKHSCFSSPLQR